MIAYYCKTHSQNDVWSLLNFACREAYGKSAPPVAKSMYGKPFFPNDRGIHFSVSHTIGCVMVVIGPRLCGCDVERERCIQVSTMERVANSLELSCFSALELWTLKESLYKAIGSISGEKALAFAKANSFDWRDNMITCHYEKEMTCVLHYIEGFQMAVIVMRADEPISFVEVSIDSLTVWESHHVE